MNKLQLIKEIARRTGATVKETEITLAETLGAIEKGIAEDGETKIQGFGMFKTVTRGARTGRNPQNGELIQISEKTSVKFKSYLKL